jgi:hypothetical protein
MKNWAKQKEISVYIYCAFSVLATILMSVPECILNLSHLSAPGHATDVNCDTEPYISMEEVAFFK